MLKLSQVMARGPSNEHFWQVRFNSVHWFQRRRFKCEKLMDGRRTLSHDKSSHGLWTGELKIPYYCQMNANILKFYQLITLL